MYQAFSVGSSKEIFLKKYYLIVIRLNKGGYFRDQYISLLGSIDTC